MGPGGGVPAAPSRLPVPLLLLFLLLLAPCMSLIRADDSSAASNTPSATPPWSPSTAATNASGNTAANDVDNSLETASPSSSRSPHAHEDPGVPGPRGSTGSTNVTENTGGGGPGGAAHQPWKCPLTPTEEPPGTPKTLLVAYLSNVGGTDNLRRQGLVVSGAMTYAIELINRNRTIPGYRMAMVYRDTRGEMLHGTRAVVECRDMGAKAFFGPEDSCYVEAALAASLNLPMISYKCSDANVANYENTTFARTVPSAALVVRSVTALLSFYDWRKFSIVQENSLGYETMAQSLESRIKGEKRFTINSKNVFNSDLSCCEQKLPCCQTAMTKILDETYRKTRSKYVTASPWQRAPSAIARRRRTGRFFFSSFCGKLKRH